jgi:sporulation protein YlmC with PRC-barrel domain
MEAPSGRFAGAEDRLAGYRVCDLHGEKIGTVGDLFVDDLNDQLEYVGVKAGFFDLRSTLVPADVVRIDIERQLIEVFQSKDKLKDAPNFEDLEEVTAEFERQVRSHFGLESVEVTAAKPTGGGP